MTDRTQPDALRLAEELEHDPGINRPSVVAELRRLHDENTTLQQGYDAARMEIAHLNKQLVKEAARTAEEKLLADQMTLQHAHQATLHREAQERIQELVRQRDAAQEVAAMNAKSGASWAARVQELESQLEAIGAGGVEPLRSRCLHQIAEPAPAAGAVAGPVVGYRVSDPREPDLGHWLSEEQGAAWCVSEPLVLAAAPTTQAAPGAQGDALTPAEADQLEKAITDFEECGETDVPDAALQRFAAMGYLECVHYNVLPAAHKAIDAARSQKDKEGCAA